jgi:hypothetical protein
MGRIGRLFHKIQDIDYDFVYQPGLSNCTANLLSRPNVEAWELLGIDGTGPLPETAQKSRYILVEVDYFSKFYVISVHFSSFRYLSIVKSNIMIVLLIHQCRLRLEIWYV